MTRTSSIMIRTNLHGTNDGTNDVYTRRMSEILCKIPVSLQQPNELIEYSQPTLIRVTNQNYKLFHNRAFDDDGRYLNLNGNRYTLTLQISIERNENHIPKLPSRFLPLLQSNINNELVGNITGSQLVKRRTKLAVEMT